ncbi:DUF2536 family protein [Paenibacillus nanensis]|uniref:DUF2536 family protein n=1 Tax=Paenibacillus nanensis TaxID=393251 RepID=A0A3A1VID3_9BACL|nr:DUF2536 family protein [Paenibacillus nanensis]RIX59376.1 DUF2536 family protein [Paenibacillus nanensis]
MEFKLDLIETKIEFFEASTIQALEERIEKAIETNKALMLDVHAVSHQVTFDPRSEKMRYTAAVHFKLKR